MCGAIPALPGACLLVSLMQRPLDEFMSDAGADVYLIAPANAIIYGIAGACIGAYWAARRRSRLGPPRCHKCDYLLIGNVSGVCPECGTKINTRQSARTHDDETE
jgi:hypothetical protein